MEEKFNTEDQLRNRRPLLIRSGHLGVSENLQSLGRYAEHRYFRIDIPQYRAADADRGTCTNRDSRNNPCPWKHGSALFHTHSTADGHQ